MQLTVKNIFHKLLELLRLTPLSLAEKCRLAFGAAVLMVLALALMIPYGWLRKLTTQSMFSIARGQAELVQYHHFQSRESYDSVLVNLNSHGSSTDPNKQSIYWIRFEQGFKYPAELTEKEQKLTEKLRNKDDVDEYSEIFKSDGSYECSYIRIFRAEDSCISCHNAQGSARAFGRNEAVGAAVIRRGVGEISQIVLMNRIWIIVAGLVGGAGAIIAFYIITQRVILRPIRQLRALANNVAEGNLEIRSAIKTGDEYEKLSNAFNHMLDEILLSQDKLYQANRQLDEKIAELSERNIELYKANKIKGEFLANVSHEFRTPLNAILGFAEIIRDNPSVLKNDKGKRYAENIITGGKNLLNMINDLLDLAKTEAGKMRLHIEKVDLKKLCHSVVASFSGMTRKKKIKVKTSIDGKIPEMNTDPGKIQQILYNFLSNAVKFTPENGRIEIQAFLKDEKMVRISVIDTGCGIADSEREAIFEKFRQGDGSLTRASQGSGLGLAISKELALMLAGTIGMESELEKGSTFWIEIPITLAVEESQKQKQQPLT